MTSAATLLLVIGLGLELRMNLVANGQSSTSDQKSFWIRKVKMYFSYADANGNGVVAEDDFQLFIDRFISTDNGNDDRKAEIRSCASEIYKGFSWVAGGPNFKESAFIEGLWKQKDSEVFKAAYKNINTRFFGVIDLNGNGFIDIPEFARYLRCLGIPDWQNAAVGAVESADTLGDGLLDSSEFIIAKLDLITSDDKNGPGSLILGLVPDISRESGGLSIGLDIGI